MRVSVFKHPERVSEAELRYDLLLLPDWRRRQVLSYCHLIDQVQCAKAYVLLRQNLKEEYGYCEMPAFEYGAYGKPRLKQQPKAADSLQMAEHIHFNLSHCARGVMCVVADEPVGCDIELIPAELDADIAAACFSETEQRLILSADNPQVEFARLWTAKEALLKLWGIGLVDNLSDLLTSPMAENVRISTIVCEQDGYAYSIAAVK